MHFQLQNAEEFDFNPAEYPINTAAKSERKMQALQVTQLGQSPCMNTLEIPQPATGQVRLKILACGLNFADLLMIKGTYQDTPTVPFTLGLELVGLVEALGPETSGPAIGTRVAVYSGQGGLAQYGCFDVTRCLPLPDGVPTIEAAGFQIAYGTSHVALDYKARLQSGETLLVLGAAGGVGLTAVELGKLMGAKVIAAARGQKRLDIAAAAGADHLIDPETTDLREAVKALGGADVVYDPVGGDQFAAAFRACNPDGRMIVIGFASGTVPPIAANHMMVKNITVQGVNWGGYMRFKPQVLTESLRTLIDWYQAGRLKPHISHIVPFEQAVEGLDLLRTRKSTGKVVITL